MLNIDEAVSNKIANASVVCAIMVILIHTSTTAVMGSAPWWIHEMISDGIGHMAVPFFFAISGFLFAGHFDDDGWWRRENMKRIRSLLVPYLLWSTLFIGMIVGVRMLSNIASHRPWFDPEIWNSWYFMKAYGVTFGEPLHGALWYVRGLIVVVLLSPIVKFALRLGIWGVVLMYVLDFAFYRYLPSMKSHPFSYLIPAVGFAYFTLGAYLRQSGWQGRGFPKGLACVCLLLGIALAFGRNYFITKGVEGWPEYFNFFGSLLLCAGIWSIVPAAPWPKWFTSMAFPVYCIHYFVDFPLFFLPDSAWIKCTVVGWFARAAYIAFFSFVAVALLRKLMPRATRVLCGGR